MAENECSAKVDHEVDERCTEAFRYLMRVPGKDVRGMLVDAFQQWFLLSEKTVAAVKNIIGSLHCASLLIDDVEDQSTTRRGIPAAHMIYGTPTVINTANYVYFIALRELHEMECPAAMNVFITECLNLHRGQGQDICWRDQFICPTEEQYCAMVLDKTGGLFRLAVGVMQSFSGSDTSTFATTDFTPFVNAMSLYFQIRDDFINVCDSDAYAKSKGTFCEDLSEGKFSYPIIHCIKHSPAGDTRLSSLLKQRPSDLHVKQYAVSIMQATGSLRYTRDELKRLHTRCSDLLGELGGHSALSKLLATLDGQLDALLEGTEAEHQAVPAAKGSAAGVSSHARQASDVDAL